MREYLGKRHYTKEENQQFLADLRSYEFEKWKERRKRISDLFYYLLENNHYTIKEILNFKLYSNTKRDQAKRLEALLLDSSLIFPTKNKIYTHKVIECGDYYKVYNFNKRTVKKDADLEKEKFGNEFSIQKLLNDETKELEKEEKIKGGREPPMELKKIELKNIYRSKRQMENLIKSNESLFKTFVTLTFEDVKYSDISLANKKFDTWRTKIQSVLKCQDNEFKYVCVPEFQKKRGRKTGHYVVHYHLLTNLDIDLNPDLIIPQKEIPEKLKKKLTKEQLDCLYDVKYWSYGFSSVFSVENINVVGYMSKYMTKDIDDRLWGKRRYLSSHNLKKPSVVYLDEKDFMDWVRLTCIETSMELTYENMYPNKITGEVITFQEYKMNRVEE